MPHDRKGEELKVGEDYCNVTLTTDEPMYPGKYPSTITLNAKQVQKVECQE